MTNSLRQIQSFDQLIPYLEDELDWPLQQYGFDDLTFEYTPAELGLKDDDAVKIKTIHQLRPLQQGQPWGIFFVEFENKKLPVVVLRRILSHLVIKKRASANQAAAAAWKTGDLLFISAFGSSSTHSRELAFAHFHQEGDELPTLRVLGWDGGDTPLKLEYVAATLKDRLSWPDDPSDKSAWRANWAGAFRHRQGHVIRTADALAEALAALARRIRDAALLLLAHESEKGSLHTLHKAFQTALIRDLKEADFADTYAQTITYGLLTAAISRTETSGGVHGAALIAENIADIVPVTNPFLKEMLQTFLKVGGRKGSIDFDELGIQDVVELLRGEETDLPAVLRDFGNKTQGEDPVIHFYEHFLSAYDKQLKVQRGVFYTPKPVVSYIVRNVHDLLQTEFGLTDGLADTTTWGEMAQRQPELKIPEGTDPDSPFVVILDPTTGTATFLVEVVEVIYQTMTAKWQKEGLNAVQRKAAWNEYVPEHLLPRLYGYELMMAPYAIAHMKMGLKLSETGYRFGSEERVRIYLTNALESPSKQPVLVNILPALAHEAEAVNLIKRNQRFTVVVGNPPYSNYGQLNKNPFILSLLEEYKRELNEKKINLDDDFIKFIRYSQYQLETTGVGLIGMITSNTYLDGITHRQMRASLKNTFSRLSILDLHGSSKRQEKSPDGSEDENVFDIQTGVAIMVFIKFPSVSSGIAHNELWGTRGYKYAQLNKSSFIRTNWGHINPESPYWFFRPIEMEFSNEYYSWIPLKEVFRVSGSGVKTERDRVSIHWTRKECSEAVEDFRTQPDPILRGKYALKSDSRDWKVANAKADVNKNLSESLFHKILYRPFDIRHTWYSGQTRGFVGTPGFPTMRHLLDGKNLALLTCRQQAELGFHHIFCTQLIAECCAVSLKTREITSVFPLYLEPEKGELNFYVGNVPGFKEEFLRALCSKLNLSPQIPHSLPVGISPEQIFQYIYGVFHSSNYRIRYEEFLKIDFPRLPLTSNLNLFRILAQLGNELISLHLMNFALEDEGDVPTDWPRYTRLAQFSGSNRVLEKFPAANKAWQDGHVVINSSSGFVGVPEDVWNFYIGGYQVCHKWLKDRKGRTLTDADILHYCKIVTAIHETIRIMAEIDEVIEEHGGWPIQ